VRFGLIIYGSLEQASGGYLYDRKLVETLRKHGHQVEVISLLWRGYLWHLADNFSRVLLAKLQKLKLDALLQDELNHPSLFLFNARLKAHVSCPIISIVHHLRSSEPGHALLKIFYRAIEWRYLRTVDAFIFNSRTTQKAVKRLLPGPRPHVIAQPAGNRLNPKITTAQIRARARCPGPLRVIFLGNLIRRKAPHVLIEALAKLERGSIRVVFAGGGKSEPAYASRLRALVRRNKLQAWVEFCGHLGETQLAARLHTSHVLVVPSCYEGYGIAYLEGMSFGLPAIGTRAGAAAEIISNGRNGYLIQVNNAAQLAGYMQRLHQDRGLLVRLSLAARRHYLQHPSWKESLARIHAFLSSYNVASSRAFSNRRHS